MMKKTLLNCTFLALTILLLCSCSKEKIAPVEPSQATLETRIAQNYLLKYRSVILFAKLELNHETNTMNGFFIDKSGKLRTISKNYTVDITSGYVSDHILRNLCDDSVIDKTVDLSAVKLAEYTKNINKLEKSGELKASSPNTNITYALIGFQRDNSHEMSESCSPGVFDQGPSHRLIVISAKGKYNFENKAAITSQFSEWLNNFQPI